MNRKINKNIFLVLCALSIVFGSNLSMASAVRQSPDEMGEMGDHDHDHDHPDGPPQDSLAGDSASKEKFRRPLESYLFDDSLRAHLNYSWTVDMDNNDITLQLVDTLLERSQITYPFYEGSGVGSAYLGNLGGASIPLNFFERPDYSNFAFTEAFDAYMMSPEKVKYYNTKKPFTHASFYTSGSSRKEETDFNVKHYQNVSPSTGIGLDYTAQGTNGTYSSQKTMDKSLSLNLAHTGKQYTLHAGYIYNSLNMRENGGLQNSADITDTIFEMPENISVNLTDSRNEVKSNSYYLIHSYGIPLSRLSSSDFTIADQSILFVGHSFEYSRYSKKYTDTEDGAGEFYDDWYINPTTTNDSIFESLHTQRLFVQFQPWDRNGFVGLVTGGVGYDAHRYYMFTMDNYLDGGGAVTGQTGYFYGSAQGKISRYFDWKASAHYDVLGYRSGDMNLSAEASAMLYIKDRPITLSAKVENDLRRPDYWDETYFSNHYVWQNSFDKENEARIDITLKVPHIRLEAGAYQSIITDKVYYGPDVVPLQESSNVNVSGLYANKEVRIGGLHLNHRVLLQWSSNEQVIPVPLASAYLSYSYNFTAVQDVLSIQIGVDGRYNTKYYAFGYDPATAHFYNQREKELGDYLTLDTFVACKWKRMRILAKLQHFNEDLFGFERNYFTVLDYPENQRMLKLGISWTFYD